MTSISTPDLTSQETSFKPTNTIKETPMSWLVWSLGCLFYFYEFLLQVSPGVMKPELSQAFGISAQGFGILGGVYFYSYAGMQVPAGVLLDRFGPHKLLTFATLICAIATLAFAHTDNFNMALIARFCIGFGSAFAVVGTMKFAANWFPTQRFALLTGIMVAIGMSGAIGGEKPLAQFIHTFGWRSSFNVLGIVGIILAVLIFIIGKDSPNAKKDAKQSSHSLAGSFGEVVSSLARVITNPQIWLVAFYGGLVFMATPVFCGLWGVPFLESKYGFESELAATLTSMVFVGWIIGSPSWGLISDRLGLRKLPMTIGAIVALIFLSIVLYLPLHSAYAVGTCLFFFGLFSAGFLPAFSIIKEISCQKNCATALSFMNMMNMIGVALAQPLIGYLLDKFWLRSNPSVDITADVAKRTYESVHYVQSISILPLGILIAIMLLPFIKETYCKTIEE